MHDIVGEDHVDLYEKKQAYKEKAEEEAEEDHLSPSRWWFATTLFPLIAGTFGPMASTFSLCALIEHWRLIQDPTSTETEGQHVSDPSWVLAVNAVSFVIAIIANMFLLANNFGRIPFKIAQPVTIIGWYIASFMLIGLVAAAPSHLPLPPGEARTFSQAYYYAILAAALYFIVASLLVTTASGVWFGRYSSDFKLTFSQKTLMIQVLLFLGYLLSAAAVYAFVENWDYLDAVYWVDVTLFTIGYGDFSPKTHLGRSLFFPMAIGGILFVGLIVASISTLALDRASTKVSIRMVEKARQKALKKFDPKTGTTHLRPFKERRIENDPSTELKRRELEFDIMREVQQKAANDNRMLALGISVSAFVILWFIGAVAFWQAERGAGNWSYFESLYFTYVSFLTIGYGDFYPQDNSAKPVFVLWSLIALPTLTVLIGSIGGVINEGVNTITLWISDRLPEKTGALSAMKDEASKAKGSEFQSAKPPGFMDEGKSDDAKIDDPAHAEAVKGISQNMNEHPGGNAKDLAAGKYYRHYLLMKEMKNVVQHTGATPPRQYTYAEWAWFLKLLGEDESDEERHRRPWEVHESELAATANGEGPASAREQGGRLKPWSWLSQRSPLMTAVDEPKWVLERLMQTLEQELRQEGEKNLEQEKGRQPGTMNC
ncbi:MAG: Potassium channel [Alectoria fallacina]|uniref:Potassium channel n=1 Tax=Alectoria fallacina TaxID=1903189 RepID=A0A8H3PJI6_9LECA|nr:MAG: Potassium channel [Alectoria fallacina]